MKLTQTGWEKMETGLDRARDKANSLAKMFGSQDPVGLTVEGATAGAVSSVLEQANAGLILRKLKPELKGTMADKVASQASLNSLVVLISPWAIRGLDDTNKGRLLRYVYGSAFHFGRSMADAGFNLLLER